MQLDKLTIKSQEALQAAQRIAHEYSHQEMDGEHLLWRCWIKTTV
jgi:ATP-dependent Clp protease ATP-binding subunit ClpB